MRGRPGAPPPELLSVGVVEDVPIEVVAPREEQAASTDNGAAPSARGKRGRGSRGRGKAGRPTPATAAEKTAAKAPVSAPAAAPAPPPKAKRGRAAAKTGGDRPRAKKRATAAESE
jgi:hypothetical protein